VILLHFGKELHRIFFAEWVTQKEYSRCNSQLDQTELYG